MLEEFPRKQLHFIIEKYGQSIIDDTRRCRGVLKDLAPKHERETNLLLLVLEHKLIDELLQETQFSSFIKLDRLAQKLHDKVGIQKDFALWAVQSWAMALNIVSSPLPQKHDENPSNSSLTLSNPPINISFTQKNLGKFIVQNEIAIDLQMKLMWLRFAYGQRWLDGELVGLSQKVNWENAMKIPEFFNQQNYLGYNDWRLPNIYELKTLIDMEMFSLKRIQGGFGLPQTIQSKFTMLGM
jgi:hypothetical protein